MGPESGTVISSQVTWKVTVRDHIVERSLLYPQGCILISGSPELLGPIVGVRGSA